MVNKVFEVGQHYKSDVNGKIFEVEYIKTNLDGKKLVGFKHEKTGEVYDVNLRIAQMMLLTKI